MGRAPGRTKPARTLCGRKPQNRGQSGPGAREGTTTMNLHPVVIPASITHSGARRSVEGWQEAAERYAREAGTHGLTPQQRAALMADAAAARVQARKWAAKERFCRKG